MLRRQLSIYFLFRFFTAAAGLAQVLLTTTALGVEGYGSFSLLFASASIIKVILADWLSKAIIRFVDVPNHYEQIFLYHLVVQIIFFVFALFLFCVDYIELTLILLLVMAESGRLFLMESFRSKGEARTYGVYTLTVSLVLALAAGALNFYVVDYREFTFIWCASVISISVFFGLPLFRKVSISTRLCLPCRYIKAGLPLSLSDAVSQFAFSGVRLLIAGWFGTSALGTYCFIYDIVQRTVVAYMQVVNSAIFPFWRRSWDLNEMGKVRRYQRYNISLLTIPSVAAVLLLAVSSRYIGMFFDTDKFDNSVALVLSIGLGVIFNRLRTFHFDYFYVLAGKPEYILILACITMMFMMLIVFFVNTSFGMIGVSLSVASGYFVGLVLSIATFRWLASNYVFPGRKK